MSVAVRDGSFEAALIECGWEPAGSSPACFALCGGNALIELIDGRSEWRSYALRGSAVGKSNHGRLLLDNYDLCGPAKWVAGGKRGPVCRVDVPTEWPAANKTGCSDPGPRAGLGPWQTWAEAITALALRRPAGPAPEVLALDELAGELERAGWAATVDDGVLRVHLSLPDLYREIRLERRSSAEVRIAADVTAWGDLTAASRRAALALALAANTRLPWVRFALTPDGEAAVLRAEISLSAHGALVPGAWLPTAVELVETAIALTAREMQALRDEELAQLVLAALAAQPRKER